jgi:hypothetical protein
VGVAWRGVRAELGWNGKHFTTSFLMRRDPISVEALQLLAAPAPLPPDSWLTREVLYIARSGFDS